MCKFFSAVITYKNKKLLWDLDADHHSDLLDKNGIKDTELKPKFVKLEYTPENGDIFDFNLKNWSLNVDQDYVPGWYDEKIALRMCKKAIKQVFKERFLVDKKIDILEGKVLRYVKNSRIKIIKNSQVGEMWGSSQVGKMRGSSILRSFSQFYKVNSQKENSLIYELYDNPTVLLANSKIKIVTVK